MRILAVSDMHGEIAPVFDLVRRIGPDLLLSCGDWGDPGQLTAKDYQGLLSLVHTLTVFGNHDDLELLATLKNSDGSPVLLKNGEVREALGVRVAGINGIWAKSHAKAWYITDEEVVAAGDKIGREGTDILITHGCAVGLNDPLPGGRRGGQRCFLDAFKAANPRVYLCGHLHVQQVKVLKDGRLAANVGQTAKGEHILLQCAGGEFNFEGCGTKGCPDV